MREYRVDYVQLTSGKSVSAEKVVCPLCHVLDMNTQFVQGDDVLAECSRGHQWMFTARADA